MAPSPCFWGALDLFTHWGRNYKELEQKLSSPVRTSQSLSFILFFFFKASSFLPEHHLYSMDELFQVIQKLMLAEIKKSPTIG